VGQFSMQILGQDSVQINIRRNGSEQNMPVTRYGHVLTRFYRRATRPSAMAWPGYAAAVGV